jgi:tyrosine-protein phosphatase SIW14
MRRMIARQLVVLMILFSLPAVHAAEQQARPASWAKPVKAKYVKNFYQLDEKLFRSAQPNEEGFGELEQLGIKNVLSFRDYHSDEDAEGTHLKLFRIKMEAGDISDDQVIEALRIIKNADGPILIHCWHGSDRTGLISAMYRIVFQNWSKDDAIEELTKGGYGYHSLYRNIPEYIRKVDVEGVKKKVMSEPTVKTRQ